MIESSSKDIKLRTDGDLAVSSVAGEPPPKAKYFKFFASDYDFTSELTDEELGSLFRAMLQYFNHGIVTDFSDRFMKLAFANIKRQIDCSNTDYEKSYTNSSYGGYCSASKRSGKPPLSRKEWEQHKTDVDYCEHSSTPLNCTQHHLTALNQEQKNRRIEEQKNRRTEEQKNDDYSEFDCPPFSDFGERIKKR